MTHVNLNHKKTAHGIICDFSSQADDEHSINCILKDEGFWISKKNNSMEPEYFIIDFHKEVPINFIQILTSPAGKTTFPTAFRIEKSNDGINWTIIHTEKKLEIEDSNLYILDIPITFLKYLKVHITKPKRVGLKYFSEIGKFTAGISGVKSISASSSSSYEHDISKILDNRHDTYWESDLKSNNNSESIEIDLGSVFHLNSVILTSSFNSPNGFPENFRIEMSPDKNIWTSVIEEKKFYAEISKKYLWEIDITPARFIHIDMDGQKLENGNFGNRISGIEISGVPLNHFHTHNIGKLTPYASIFQAGIVKIAKDGDDHPGTVVQGNDSRLRNASTIFKGIVKLAEDSENEQGTVVQASDSRLKNATEFKKGIVRLSKDREDTPGTVVQGNDSRLIEATEHQSGIVKLCPDGIYSELGVVTGNDSRLQKAAAASFGISRLAANGENSQGCAVQGNDRRLKDATTTSKGIVELAEDGEERPNVAVQGNDKRLKDATTTSKGIVELAEDGENRPDVVIQGNDKRLKEATTVSKGIVELAEDGENRLNVAVQGNDKRLKDATTVSKGIVELAEDGEDRPDVVIQGNDKRLKEATTVSKGIVELAEDGEDISGVVIQGNDKRLKEATTVSKGIVELAEDGEDRPDVVVQGNDKRLKEGTTVSKGIIRFADNCEEAPLAAVQGNDNRLRNATTINKGIVELAEDGEDEPGVAVQGNDKRLKEGTTVSKGIVELAEDGEDRPGVAVQGNDKRLKEATEEKTGIARLARDGEMRKGICVQANDKRLSDPRPSLPHKHDFAPLQHEFNSHRGTLKIIEEKNEKFEGIVPPSDNSAIIYAKNESDSPGAIGITGISSPSREESRHSYGVLGHSKFVGIRGQSTGNPDSATMGCGILGVSRFGAGGVFASEHSFSLVAEGHGEISKYDNSPGLIGNGDALLVNGKSKFNGRVYIQNNTKEKKFPANIVEMFEVDNAYYIVPGDLLVVSEKGNSILSRSKASYCKSVIGVVSCNPSVIINNSGEEKTPYPVVLAGKTMCRVDARERPIKPGDLIVTSDKPGCGMAGTIDSFSKIGSVIGKAIDGLEQGIGTIPIFITHI